MGPELILSYSGSELLSDDLDTGTRPLLMIVIGDLDSAYSGPGFEKWRLSLFDDGYDIVTWQITSNASPKNIRDKMRSYAPRLKGALFVGDVPSAYTINLVGSDTSDWHYSLDPSDHYYMNLHGSWQEGVDLAMYVESQQDRYANSAHFDNTFNQFGNKYIVMFDCPWLNDLPVDISQYMADIFVGRISSANTDPNMCSGLDAYFERATASHYGEVEWPSTTVFAEGIDGDPAHGMNFTPALSVAFSGRVESGAQLGQLLSLDSSLMFITAHSTPVAHWLDQSFSVDDLYKQPIRTKILMANACSACRYDTGLYLGGQYLLGQYSECLAVLGFTGISGFNNLAVFSEEVIDHEGGRLYEAFLTWFNYDLQHRSFPSNYVLLGDPSIEVTPAAHGS